LKGVKSLAAVFQGENVIPTIGKQKKGKKGLLKKRTDKSDASEGGVEGEVETVKLYSEGARSWKSDDETDPMPADLSIDVEEDSVGNNATESPEPEEEPVLESEKPKLFNSKKSGGRRSSNKTSRSKASAKERKKPEDSFEQEMRKDETEVEEDPLIDIDASDLGEGLKITEVKERKKQQKVVNTPNPEIEPRSIEGDLVSIVGQKLAAEVKEIFRASVSSALAASQKVVFDANIEDIPERTPEEMDRITGIYVFISEILLVYPDSNLKFVKDTLSTYEPQIPP
jgi:hypothetical protein